MPAHDIKNNSGEAVFNNPFGLPPLFKTHSLCLRCPVRFNELPSYAHQKEVASGSVACFFLYYILFGIGMQGVPWLYPTGINSMSMRTKGAVLGTASNWAFHCESA